MHEVVRRGMDDLQQSRFWFALNFLANDGKAIYQLIWNNLVNILCVIQDYSCGLISDGFGTPC